MLYNQLTKTEVVSFYCAEALLKWFPAEREREREREISNEFQ